MIFDNGIQSFSYEGERCSLISLTKASLQASSQARFLFLAGQFKIYNLGMVKILANVCVLKCN
eukprot:m.176828 g.176828  ORF g.176828 m.176828 type:complete len:63 (-) comp15448_c0_seq21:546-734(-)